METADLPPTSKGRQYELRALGLRDFAGLKKLDEPLNPFDLARFAKLEVVQFDAIKDLLSPETLEHLLGAGSNKWSGGASGIPLPNGRKLIILNPTHSPARHQATLMEEICHVFLGHKPSRLEIKNHNKKGEEIARDYDEAMEEEAYSVGAAALVPYAGLRDFVRAGKTSREIAGHFNVSRELVEYRMKVSRLWKLYTETVGTKMEEFE
ncbi:MAG TPA: ImmA/IrrE family metallo-endopeptidase [Pyrinomonadaceae bacterium]